MFAGYLAAFDVTVTPEFLVAEGDMVVIRDTNRVRHKGAFQGIPATDKELSLPSTDIYQIVDGRIVEQWFEADYLSFMQQLGTLPTPGQAGRQR
jgi:predicted ester cyclase